MSEKSRSVTTIGQAMRQDRARTKRDRQRLKRSWSLAAGNDMDAVAECHGLHLARTRGGLSVQIMRGAWIAGNYFGSTRTLLLDGGVQYQADTLERAIEMVASVLRLD